MLPVFWASEEGSLTLSLANKFKEEVYGVEYAIEGGVFAAIGLAGKRADSMVVGPLETEAINYIPKSHTVLYTCNATPRVLSDYTCKVVVIYTQCRRKCSAEVNSKF